MTQEEKELLFKDLSARLPYGVRVKILLNDGTTEEGILDFEHTYNDVLRDAFYLDEIEDIKPYLRPMSSMTEEEIEIFNSDFGGIENGYNSIEIKRIDWLNAHHFDYRGLIEKGLALVAPEGIYD